MVPCLNEATGEKTKYPDMKFAKSHHENISGCIEFEAAYSKVSGTDGDSVVNAACTGKP